MNIQELCKKAGFGVRSYSGRGMYGKECLGVSLDGYDTMQTFIADLLDAVANENSNSIKKVDIIEVADAIRDIESDSLGTGKIVYFKSIEFEAEEDNKGDFEPFNKGDKITCVEFASFTPKLRAKYMNNPHGIVVDPSDSVDPESIVVQMDCDEPGDTTTFYYDEIVLREDEEQEQAS